MLCSINYTNAVSLQTYISVPTWMQIKVLLGKSYSIVGVWSMNCQASDSNLNTDIYPPGGLQQPAAFLNGKYGNNIRLLVKSGCNQDWDPFAQYFEHLGNAFTLLSYYFNNYLGIKKTWYTKTAFASMICATFCTLQALHQATLLLLLFIYLYSATSVHGTVQGNNT